MDIKTLSQFIELGIAGVAVVGLLLLMWFILTSHKDERKQWMEQNSEERKETKEVLEKLTTVIDTINRSNRM